jgi:hypothetical protein
MRRTRTHYHRRGPGVLDQAVRFGSAFSLVTVYQAMIAHVDSASNAALIALQDLHDDYRCRTVAEQRRILKDPYYLYA